MRLPAFFLSGILVFLAGCATTVPSTTNTPEKGPAFKTGDSTGKVKLRNGMPVKELQAALGEPSEKKMIKTTSGAGEIWIYRRAFEVVQRIEQGSAPVAAMGQSFVQVTSGGRTTEVPVASAGNVQPVPTVEEYRQVKETTLIFIVDGQVTTWDRTSTSTGGVR